MNILNIFNLYDDKEIECLIKLLEISFTDKECFNVVDPELKLNKAYFITDKLYVQIIVYKNNADLIGAFIYDTKFIALDEALELMSNKDKKIFLYNLDFFI